MRTKLISIGNSKGIRLRRALIQWCGLGDKIELSVRKNQLIIKPVRKLREGWEEAFRQLHELGDDQLLDMADAHTEPEWDRTEWTW